MNFESGGDFYDWLEDASSPELHEFMLEHSSCFTDDLCEEEDDLLANDEIDELFVCEIARAGAISEESLRHLWSLDTGGDGDRYTQKCWALLESPNLTVALLNEIEPFGALMTYAVTSHQLANSTLVKKVFTEGLISLEETIDFIASNGDFTEEEIESYRKSMQGALNP